MCVWYFCWPFRLVKGAKQAGLDPSYIDKLSKHPTYKPNDATLKARKERPKMEVLKEITVEELSQNQNWVGCLGYVLEPDKIIFNAHRGTDFFFAKSTIEQFET